MTPTEKKVSAICAGILGLDDVDANDDLFDLGSDSHQAVLVALEIERSFHVKLPLQVMETSARIRTLSTWIDEQIAEVPTSDAKPEPAANG